MDLPINKNCDCHNRGFGFVTFESHKDAQISLDNVADFVEKRSDKSWTYTIFIRKDLIEISGYFWDMLLYKKTNVFIFCKNIKKKQGSYDKNDSSKFEFTLSLKSENLQSSVIDKNEFDRCQI